MARSRIPRLRPGARLIGYPLQLTYVQADPPPTHLEDADGEELVYVHDFGEGVELYALPDGSLWMRLADPRYPGRRLWREDP